MKACLDNHILIWGIRAIARPGQEPMINRAKALLHDLSQSNADVLVPSVVVGEFLAGVPKEQHAELINVLNRRFQVAPYDIRAAATAAALWRDYAEKNPNLRDLIQAQFPGTERAKIKADVQILAIALVRRADVLYTHDGPLKTIATGLIEVRELPTAPPVQSALQL